MIMVITITGRRGLLCRVGGQLTNMQPIRTRKLANFVKTDDDDNDHYGEYHDDNHGVIHQR